LKQERADSDPLARFLADERSAALTSEMITAIDGAILAEIDRGFEVALAAADPTPDKLFTMTFTSTTQGGSANEDVYS
jgi:TPP-dependent pyruvate/acetoin dehydrogenase alpha subunit